MILQVPRTNFEIFFDGTSDGKPREIPVQKMIFKWWVFHIYVKLLEGNG